MGGGNLCFHDPGASITLVKNTRNQLALSPEKHRRIIKIRPLILVDGFSCLCVVFSSILRLEVIFVAKKGEAENIPPVFPAIDNDLAVENLENDFDMTAADRQDLEGRP